MFFWLVKNIWRADVLFVWFADYHSLLPVIFSRIFGKKSVVMLGGMDAVKLPEVNQGVYLRPFRGLCAKLSVRYCDLVIACDASLIEFENTYAGNEPIKAGVKNLVPHFHTNNSVIPFGFDDKKWHPGTGRKESLVLTVGLASQIHKAKLKGMDLLVEAAKQIPDAEFLIIGAEGEGEEFLAARKPGNVTLMGRVANDELVKFYQKAKVYVQLSLSEGLPNVLCEAMLCGCVPVGSNVNGIPTAIGEAGFIVYERKVESAVEALKKALAAEDELGKKARERMQQHFSLELREKRLVEAIKKLV